MRLSQLLKENWMEDDFDGKLYHVAGRSNTPSILRLGIKPISYWSTASLTSYYAEVMQDEGDDPVVFALPLQRFERAHLRPDKPGLEEPITTVVGADEDEIWEAWSESDQSWESCLKLIGSVSYTGTVEVDETDIV